MNSFSSDLERLGEFEISEDNGKTSCNLVLAASAPQAAAVALAVYISSWIVKALIMC